MNVRERQLAAVERMLRLGEGWTVDSQGLGQQWKVLIYDSFCRDVISPLLTVGRLRENGVTLHMLLDSPRESIPDVPAVYLMQPTEANVHLFVQDCQKQLYDCVYLNFCAPISARLMELLARRLVEINAVAVVTKVYDQFLGFVSLEPLLFTLNLKGSFEKYNRPALPDVAIEQCMDDISKGICSMIVTMGLVPVVRCTRNGPAQMVARKVCESIAKFIEKETLFSTVGGGRSVLEQRPVLLIVDRSVDMAAPLLHTSKYQSLADDLLDYGLNRVKIVPLSKGDQGGQFAKTPKTHTLDKEGDSFWAKYGGELIPIAAEAYQTELQAVKFQEEKIKKQTGRDASSFDMGAEDGDSSSLLSTVQSLPALLEKRKFLEKHFEILEAIMAVVSNKKVHKFAEQEEKMAFSQYADKSKVLALASDPSLYLEDKIRFLAVYMLTVNPSAQDADEVKQATLQSSADEQIDPAERESLLQALKYVNKILSLSRFGKGEVPSSSGDVNTGGGNLWDLASLTKQAISNASRQVRTMVGESRVLPAVRMMDLATNEAVTEAQINEQDAQLLYLDPKVSSFEVPPKQRARNAFNRGILFVVGGGCFAEYQNLQDYADGKIQVKTSLQLGNTSSMNARSSNGREKSFIYGCSELVNASKFIRQLANCSS